METVTGPVAELFFVPADSRTRRLKGLHSSLQRLRATRPERGVAKARGVGGGQLQRVSLIVVSGPQVHGITPASALRHTQNIYEKP
jgi:hypothetical protein